MRTFQVYKGKRHIIASKKTFYGAYEALCGLPKGLLKIETGKEATCKKCLKALEKSTSKKIM